MVVDRIEVLKRIGSPTWSLSGLLHEGSYESSSEIGGTSSLHPISPSTGSQTP